MDFLPIFDGFPWIWGPCSVFLEDEEQDVTEPRQSRACLFRQESL